MGAATLQQIPNAQRNFDVIKRLQQEISRARFERPTFGFFVGISGQNDDGQKQIGVFRAERFENVEAIRLGHHQIEKDEVGLKLFATRQNLFRIRGGFETSVAILNENLFQQRDIHRLVIDN